MIPKYTGQEFYPSAPVDDQEVYDEYGNESYANEGDDGMNFDDSDAYNQGQLEAYGQYEEDGAVYEYDPSGGEEVDEYGDPLIYPTHDHEQEHQQDENSSSVSQWIPHAKIYPIALGTITVCEYDQCQELLWAGREVLPISPPLVILSNFEFQFQIENLH